MDVNLDSSSSTARHSDLSSAAALALEHFGEWDKDRNSTLSRDELKAVKERFTSGKEHDSAVLLDLNFDQASTLNATKPGETTGISWNGQDTLKSAFDSDSTVSGISRQDLVALDMLASSSGLYTFTQKVEANKRNGMIADFSIGGISAILTGLLLRKALQGDAKTSTWLLMGGIGMQTLSSVFNFANSISTNDLPTIETEFRRRQAMLDSWKRR